MTKFEQYFDGDKDVAKAQKKNLIEQDIRLGLQSYANQLKKREIDLQNKLEKAYESLVNSSTDKSSVISEIAKIRLEQEELVRILAIVEKETADFFKDIK